MNIQEITQALLAKGVDVIGTIEEFYKHPAEQGLWIGAEGNGGKLFDYYREDWIETSGVNPELNKFVEDNGWYFEWYDTGTIFLIQD